MFRPYLFGDMRKLQSIDYGYQSHSVIVTAAPQSPRIAGASEIGVCVQVEAPLAGVVADARICHVAGRLHGGISLSPTRTGLPTRLVGSQFGSQATEREQVFVR
jgi:hypothetical protein